MVRKFFSPAALFVAVALAVASVAAAEPKTPYQPMGAPLDPKVPAQWNRYHDYAAATELLKALAAAHPWRARLQSLGRSYGGREMWLLTITNFERGDDRTKPALWIDAGIHANEIQATEVALYTAWYLLEMEGRLPAVRALLEGRTFYLLPMISPDSRDAHMYRPNSTHSPRSGQRPVDDDLDGLFDEDGPDDLDGDGQITQMRVRDPNGRWKPHPEFPDRVIPAADDEPGQYRLLGTEGYDNDGDGRVDEDGDGYYDPNRDWGWDWQPPYVQGGAYRYPFSIAENRMAAEFIRAHDNIAASQSFHNMGGLILRGPGAKDAQFEPTDARLFDAIAKRGEAMLPGYRAAVIGRDLYETHGNEIDWLYMNRGVVAFTNELFTASNYFRRPAGSPADLSTFDKYLLLGQGTVPWHTVEHPQYGKIEVGGLKKQWGRQPPSFLLEEECHRNMAFTLYHAEQLPTLEIQAVDVGRLSGGLVQVTATVANRRMIPTHTAIDVKHKITPPDLVRMESPAARVLAGLWSADPALANAKPQRHRPEELRIPTIPGMDAIYLRWLVDGPAPYTIRVLSPKGGTVEFTAH
jgi:hypothetical protein